MQVLNIEGFEKRVLYNAANQLRKGDDFGTLRPIIALTVADFLMFDDDDDPADRIITRFASSRRTPSSNTPRATSSSPSSNCQNSPSTSTS